MKRRALLALVLLSGCSTAPYEVGSGAMDDLSKRDQRATWTGECMPGGVEFVDDRRESSMGVLGMSEFRIADFATWVARQVHAAIPVSPASQSTLVVRLKRAYLETNQSTLSFTTLLSAHWSNEPASSARYYRGMDTKVSWWGADAELANYAERAAARAVDAMLLAESRNCN
jgi:hypothetical protein